MMARADSFMSISWAQPSSFQPCFGRTLVNRRSQAFPSLKKIAQSSAYFSVYKHSSIKLTGHSRLWRKPLSSYKISTTPLRSQLSSTRLDVLTNKCIKWQTQQNSSFRLPPPPIKRVSVLPGVLYPNLGSTLWTFRQLHRQSSHYDPVETLGTRRPDRF